ncbi:MAG: WbqC family protein [Paludibacteraceae bacterium]|nr:WbqC family protein [Paludibacteraceae bacterium]
MNVSIHQPDYIPWLGLFYKMYLSDVFIHLDDAQYSNEAAHNYNKIKTPQGLYRIKFPVEQHLGDTILQVRPRYELNWQEKHLRTFEMNYSKAKCFKEVYPEFKEVFMVDYPNVAELNIAINEFLAGKFGINPKFVRSSDYHIATKREEKVIDLCLAVGGSRYISGNGARVYQEESHFTDKGIELTYLDYKPIEYHQLWKDFIPCMSVLDYIFNCGYDWDFVIKQVAELNERDR